jgi:hypothetical protein
MKNKNQFYIYEDCKTKKRYVLPNKKLLHTFYKFPTQKMEFGFNCIGYVDVISLRIVLYEPKNTILKVLSQSAIEVLHDEFKQFDVNDYPSKSIEGS